MNTCRHNYKTTLLCWVAVSALLLGGVVRAKDQKPQLTPDEQKQFNQLSPELQKALKEMTPDRQKQFLARMADMTPKQRERQAAFEEMRKALAVKDPDQKMDAMAEFVKSHGEFMKDGGDGPANIAFGAQDYLPLRKGATVVAQLRATIDSGWHLYSLDQEPGGPTATKIRVADGQPFKIHGDIDQPTPISKLDPNFNLETHFYEREVTFKIPLTVATSVKSKQPLLSIDVLYQTCNDTTCLPPTVDLAF